MRNLKVGWLAEVSWNLGSIARCHDLAGRGNALGRMDDRGDRLQRGCFRVHQGAGILKRVGMRMFGCMRSGFAVHIMTGGAL